jgi:hypothetical protein
MAIVKPPPPAGVSAAVTAGFQTFSIGTDAGVRTQADVAQPPVMPAGIPASLPVEMQPVYVLSLADAQTVGGPAAATPAGWRFFAGNAAPNMMLGRITRSNPSEQWRVTAAYTGDRVEAAYHATMALASLPRVQSYDYELRVLMAPALNLEAFWLVSQSSAAPDLVAPFALFPEQLIPALRTDPLFSVPHFTAIVRQAALLLRYGSGPGAGLGT